MENVLINIDSKFRNIEKYPNPGNFTYILKDPLKNINFIRLSSIELPTTYYTFLAAYDNISFSISKPNGIYFTITIDEGNYSSENMIEIIQYKLNINNTLYNTNFLITWNEINYKITISDTASFSLILGNDNKHRSLGHRLGYIFDDSNYLAKNQVSASDKYKWVSDSFLNITKDEYLFVRINDYGVIYNDLREKSLLAKIILSDAQFVIDNGSNFLTKTYIFKQLINLSKFEIELINQYGQTVDMNYIDFSITLEVGQIYDSNDYNKYNFDLRKRY
jgi:hypothetical protein